MCISDIDECSEKIDLCEHDCYNTNGSYVCDCEPGYKIDMSGVFCSGKQLHTLSLLLMGVLILANLVM